LVFVKESPAQRSREMDTTPEEEYVRQRLDLFVPDLLARGENERFVRRLFASEKGSWLSVRLLCDGISEVENLFRSIETTTPSDLYVLWLDHPTDPDYGYVHFYLPDFFWTNSGIYDRKLLGHE
jgi:hypothetical protein